MSQRGYGNTDPESNPFDYYVPLTGFSISPQSSSLVLNPAGTLATGTVLLPANPLDGQSLQIVSNQTQTALTVTAAAGDSIQNAPTALVANTPVSLRYCKFGVPGSTGYTNGSPVASTGTNHNTWLRIS